MKMKRMAPCRRGVLRVIYLCAFVGVCLGSPAPAQTITEFPLPNVVSGTDAIAEGPDGNLWFTNAPLKIVGRMTAEGVVTEFADPVPDASPSGITAGPDGNLWFTTNGIGRISTDGVITNFAAPAGPSITVGPDGKLWFAATGGRIGRITTSGVVDTVGGVLSGDAYGIVTGPDGNVWFTEPQVNIVGRMTPAGELTEFDVPTANARPLGIAAGADGNVWFAEGGLSGVSQIGRITPDGVFSEFAVPTQGSLPNGISLGPDANMWFTESVGYKIGRITMSGEIAEFPVPPPGFFPVGITGGSDGAVWFTASAVIGRLSTTAAPVGPRAAVVPSEPQTQTTRVVTR